MKNKRARALIVLIFLCIAINVHAKTLAPAEVPPVIDHGVKYIAPHFTAQTQTAPHQNGGVVQAWDIKTNKMLWEVTVYKTDYDPKLERDVQDVFITSMKMDRDKLLVVNQKGESFHIDPKTRTVTAIKK